MVAPVVGRRAWLGLAPAMFGGLFFAWPVGAIIARGFSFGGFADVLHDAAIRQAAWFTLWQATVSTVLTLLVGLPVATLLGRYRVRGARVIESLLVVPFVLPTVVVGAAFLSLLPSRWHGTAAAIIAAHVFFNLAVVVRTVAPAWRQLDSRQEDVARTLGAHGWRLWTHVLLPPLRSAIWSAAAVTFLFCFTSFGVVLMLGGGRRRTLEVEIYRLTAQLLDLRSAAALAFLQLAVLGLGLTWTSRAQRRSTVTTRTRAAVRRARPLAAVGVLAPCLVFVAAPLVALARRSGDWTQALRGRGGQAITHSLWVALIAAALATTIGLLACLAIASGGLLGRGLDVLVTVPLGTSAVTVGFGMIVAFSGAIDLRGRWWLIPAAHAIIGLPFVVRLVLPALRGLPTRRLEAAATLGASPLHVFVAVEWPRIKRPVALAAGFAFAVSLGEFGATAFLVRRGNPTLTSLIQELLGRPGTTANAQAHALALVLALLTGGILFLIDLANDR